MLRIGPGVEIPDEELTFTASRSGGPGGQSVNKLNTRVTLLFDLAGSPSLTPDQKRRIGARFSSRINKEGVLRVVCQEHRSQSGNRAEAVSRFVEMLETALRRVKRRVRTRTPYAAKQRRLDGKKRRGRLKRDRSWKPGPGD